MSKVNDAVECFRSGAACSQAIAAAYGTDYSLIREQAMKLAAGFGGGMCMGETCGAVTGAFMMLGPRFAGADCDQRDGRDDINAIICDFVARFEKRNGSVACKELLGCDVSTSVGVQKATDEGLFGTICPKLVQDAAEILEEML